MNVTLTTRSYFEAGRKAYIRQLTNRKFYIRQFDGADYTLRREGLPVCDRRPTRPIDCQVGVNVVFRWQCQMVLIPYVNDLFAIYKTGVTLVA